MKMLSLCANRVSNYAMSGKQFNCAVLIFLFTSLVSTPVAAADAAVAEVMRLRVEQLSDAQQLQVGDARIAAYRVIPDFYARRNFQLAWQNPDKAGALLNIVRSIDDEGLEPNDYHYQALVTQYDKVKQDGNIENQVALDILLTDSLVRLLYHLRFGKVDPNRLDAHWNLTRSINGTDPAVLIQNALDADQLSRFIDNFVPRQAFYVRYKQALAKYKTLKEKGGWSTVPAGPTIKPGMSGPRVKLIRQRLTIEGDLEGKPAGTASYDAQLESAVKRFQARHGLEADGVVGKQTLQAMNVSVDERIDQIRVNLERGRWLLQDIKGDFIIVNIAGFYAHLVRNDEVAWTTRVMVGKTYRKTPVFKSEMKYLVFNPTWTVPPGILHKDILPKARKDPDHIRKRGLNVLDKNGKKIDPNSIDWASLKPGRFPYQLQQPPGPKNALGLVKFIFPNEHLVYLHDTPNRALFSRPERTFSSGCIRVEKPFELAELLLNDPDTWSQEGIDQVLESEKTRTVFLPEPLPVLLLYWTVTVDADGTVNFIKDVYDRDRAVLKKLNGEFVISLPKGLPEKYYQ